MRSTAALQAVSIPSPSALSPEQLRNAKAGWAKAKQVVVQHQVVNALKTSHGQHRSLADSVHRHHHEVLFLKNHFAHSFVEQKCLLKGLLHVLF